MLVGSSTGYLREITEPLARSGFKIKAFIPDGDPLWGATHIHDKYLIPSDTGESLLNFIFESEELLNSNGWFLWSSIETSRAIARSSLTKDVKSRLLNQIKTEEMCIVGSRTNQIQLFKKLGLVYPRSCIVHNYDALAEMKFDFPTLIKGDLGGGGYGVRDFTSGKLVKEDAELSANFPVVIQEKLDGATTHVEAFFQCGRLLYWGYSENPKTHHGYRYCPVRHYMKPHDNECLEAIVKIGRYLNISGPVGFAFIREAKTNQHFIIEVDVNAGIWHHSFSFFGFDLVGALMDLRNESNPLRSDESLDFYDPRECFEKSMTEGKFVRSLAILLGRNIEGHGAPMETVFLNPRSRLRALISYIQILIRSQFKLMRGRTQGG